MQKFRHKYVIPEKYLGKRKKENGENPVKVLFTREYKILKGLKTNEKKHDILHE